MFISISTTQSSLWGWKQRPLASTGISVPTGLPGTTFTNYTYSPTADALYAISTKPDTNPYIMVLNPGDCNSDTSDYSQTSGQLISPNGGTRANFPASNTYSKAGILAQDGKIYFIPFSGSQICILVPNANPSLVSWTFFDLVPTYTSSSNNTYIAGGILGKDGKIYILPFYGISTNTATPLARLNISGPTPVVEMSYYTGTSAATALSGSVTTSNRKNVDFLGYNPTGTYTTSCLQPNSDSATAPNQFVIRISNYSSRTSLDFYFSLDPYSNKIYVIWVQGTWIFYIDPDNWSNINCINTVNTLWLRTLKPGLQGYRSSNSVSGCANNGYKFSAIVPGLNKKLYITISNAGYTRTSGSINIPNDLLYHIELDTQTNTISLVQNGINANLTTGTYSGAGMLPNGVIFGVPTLNYSSLLPNNKSFEITTGAIPKVIGDNASEKKCAIDVKSTTASAYGAGVFSIATVYQLGSPGSTFITIPGKNKRGKFIISGSNNVYGMEVMSIKNFYNNVTNFNLKNTLDTENTIDILEPPTNLANLPTSDYNLYVNRPR
jgi:hypothetical protein